MVKAATPLENVPIIFEIELKIPDKIYINSKTEPCIKPIIVSNRPLFTPS